MAKRSKSMRKFLRKVGKQTKQRPERKPIDPMPDTAPAAAFQRLKEELGISNWERWLNKD